MLASNSNNRLLLLTFLIFLTRIPFIFAGYGSEEDAWGLILTARNIDLTGIYEVSRLPGHPLQELLLSLLWELPAWSLNLTTAAVSATGVYFFMMTLKKLPLSENMVLLSGIALAFTPVFYLHSSDIMDYTWALSFILIAFYLVVCNRNAAAGLFIGIACGFRITAGAMVIPFAIWHFLEYRSFKNIFLLGMITVITAICSFIPVYRVYGSDFFTYYEYFPYPPFLKNIYKGTIGAWGLVGFAGIAYGLFFSVIKFLRLKGEKRKSKIPLLLLCITAILLYTYSFLKIPQKTAFVLPVVPFVILLFAMLLNRKQMFIVTICLFISCFFIGVNLDDPIRGSESSALSYRTNISESPVSFDLLSGLVVADHSKRKQKMEYAASITNRLSGVNQKTVIVAGWWQNEMRFYSIENNNPLVSYLYYADEKELRDSLNRGNKIFYLPEQDFYNDLRFRSEFTAKLATPLGK